MFLTSGKELEMAAVRHVVKSPRQTRGYSAAVDQLGREQRMSEGTKPHKVLRVSTSGKKLSEGYETISVPRRTERALGVDYREGNKSARTNPYTQKWGAQETSTSSRAGSDEAVPTKMKIERISLPGRTKPAGKTKKSGTYVKY